MSSNGASKWGTRREGPRFSVRPRLGAPEPGQVRKSRSRSARHIRSNNAQSSSLKLTARADSFMYINAEKK